MFFLLSVLLFFVEKIGEIIENNPFNIEKVTHVLVFLQGWQHSERKLKIDTSLYIRGKDILDKFIFFCKRIKKMHVRTLGS